MKVRLDKIVEEPYRWHERRSVDPASLDRPELAALGEVAWGGTIEPTSTGYLFDARLAYDQTVVCPRCLEPAVHPAESEVQLIVVPDEGLPTIGEHRLEDAELSLYPLDGETLDTDPILIEQLQLNLPMYPLCSDDCAGLCPECGANRNREQCDCRPATDPRWAALVAIRGGDANPADDD